MTAGITPTISINNFLLTEFAKSSICVKKSCILSHKLAEIDKKNFGLQYSENSKNTNIFPRICSNCLVAKFGIYESTHTETISSLPCIKTITQGKDVNDRLEGPYLRAFKSVNNIIDNSKIVFNKNTIIFPAGKLLLDLLMADPDVLFNNNSKIPNFRIRSSISTETYELNPYIYSYFKHLFDKLTLNLNKNSSPRQYNHLEDILTLDKNFDSDCLDATYEIDAMLISNLINPLGALSHYISEGKTITIPDSKIVEVLLQDKPAESPTKAELANFENNNYADVTFKTKSFTNNIITSDINCVTKEKLQHFNSLLFSYILGMRQLIVNRQQGLLTYFKERHGRKLLSATGLHVASFCLPQIIYETTNIYRKYFPNVSFIEGIGLVSTADICQNELLIIDVGVSLENFTRLKMSNYEHAIKYSEIEFDINSVREEKLSYDFEGRRPKQSKMCLYAKS